MYELLHEPQIDVEKKNVDGKHHQKYPKSNYFVKSRENHSQSAGEGDAGQIWNVRDLTTDTLL